MKKRGFTLIELLAVIVILTILALIVFPTISGLIDKTKMRGVELSALNYIDAVEKQAIINELDDNDLTNIIDGVYEISDLDAKKVSVKGQKPSAGWIQIKNKQVVNYSLKINNYYINPSENSTSKVVVDRTGSIAIKPDEGIEYAIGATKVDAKDGETHKGIVYLDPTDLTNVCTESEVLKNVNEYGTPTEIKTGCMKWYIYDDSGDNYKMILDHNTTARIKWNDDNINVAYELSNLKSVVTDLVTSSGWKVTPRLITAFEISAITGKDDFDASNMNSWYNFDTLTQTKAAYSESSRSSYDWLYNNVNKCKNDSVDYGCTIEDGNTYNGYGTANEGSTLGYWSSTPLMESGSCPGVWGVNRYSRLSYFDANHAYSGIRPVITLSKSLFE